MKGLPDNTLPPGGSASKGRGGTRRGGGGGSFIHQTGRPLRATAPDPLGGRVLAGRRSPRRGGFFLVLVLIVIAVATMAVYSFTELMIAYDESAYLAGDLVQARVTAESGTEAVRLILSQSPATREQSGGIYNNATLFQAIQVSSGIDGATPSNYTIVAPDLDAYGQYGGIRYGLQNESARLNLNALVVLDENGDSLMSSASSGGGESGEAAAAGGGSAAVSLLMALPGMTGDTADAILDWIDEDEEPREFGAETEYYATLPTPYQPANGPLHSVEELLLVRGVTPTLLFGADSNRNGVIDADERQRYGMGIETPGALGWAAYLTVHGAEANTTSTGEPKVNINQDDLELLYDELLTVLGDETYASFIVAYRIAGQSSDSGGRGGEEQDGDGEDGDSEGGDSEDGDSEDEDTEDEDGGGRRGGRGSGGGPSGAESAGRWSPSLLDRLDLAAGGQLQVGQVLDLIGAEVTIGEGDDARSYSSPFTSDPVEMASYLPLLMDSLATQDVDVLPGRINLNECPAELLYGLPMLEPETVDAIVEARAQVVDDPNRDFATWPLVEGLVSLEQMRALHPLVTGGGDVYRAQIIGYLEGRGASHRQEVIVDATGANPKVIAVRDLSHLGRGFDLSVLGVRSGIGVGAN